MSIFLERFILTLFAAIAGATILTNPWTLDRVQQASLFVAIVALAVLAGRTIENTRTASNGPLNSGGSRDGLNASSQNPTSERVAGGSAPAPSARIEPSAAMKVAPPAGEAEAAAEHYRHTSPTLKREEIREAYKQYCGAIATKFGLAAWSPINQLTRMVDVNMGDVEAYDRAEKERSSTAWAAIRVLVAFETSKERPMYMAYVFIGRAPDGDEVVAVYDSYKSWKVLASSSKGANEPEALIVNTIKEQLRELDKRIAPDIRRLK